MRRQGQSAADKLSAIYGRKTGEKGAGDKEYSDEIDAILAGWKKLARQSETPLEFVFTEAAEDAAEGFGVSSAVDFTALNEAAFNYAKQRAAEMVGMKWSNGEMIQNPSARWAITDTTRDKLRQLISSAYTDSLSAADLKQAIQSSYGFSAQRAETISRTELAMAAVQGNIATAKEIGVVAKQSVLGSEHEDEDECDDAEDDGVIGIDEDFSTGDAGPPYHPNCVCDLVFFTADDPEAADFI